MTKNGKAKEMNRKNLFIVNPKSFRKKNELAHIEGEIHGYFAAHGGDYDIEVSRFPRDAIRIIQKYTQDLPAHTVLRIFAMGGDGILFDCLNGMFGLPNVELGAIPYGSTNDFVSAFGKKKEALFRNIGKQVEAGVIPTDVIHARNVYALNFATLGIESAAIHNSRKFVRDAENFFRVPRWANRGSFIITGVTALFDKTIRSQHYEITTDEGEVFARRFVCINLANGPCYGGSLTVNPAAAPDDGYLDLVLGDDVGVMKDIARTGKFLRGAGVYGDPFTYRRVRSLSIRSDQPLLIDLDGESFFDTNMSFEILPAAVSFVAPDDARYERRVTLP
jgi:diacylglycerol kinase family enzyme